MEDELRLNTKLFGFDGIIGRRDFFLNGVIISALTLFYILPQTIWLTSNMETLFDYFNSGRLFSSAPILLKIWVLLGTALVCTIGVSNIFRRLNDIIGEVKTNINLICSAIYVLASFSILLPMGISSLIVITSFIMTLVLLFKKGKITSTYPYDTWIWGLFNKSFKTLWMLILWLTPWSTHFALYCGLRGNEWAFNNKNCTDVEAFNKSQEKQTTIFAILAFLIGPIIYILIFTAIMGFMMFAVVDETKNTPSTEPTAIEKLGNVLDTVSSAYFEGHTIAENENKFFVLDSDWKGYSFSEKKDILDMAASMSANERRKLAKANDPNNYEYTSKTSELPRTKIYSSETKQLLGEFILDEKAMESGSIKEIFKAGMNAYHFYNPTK